MPKMRILAATVALLFALALPAKADSGPTILGIWNMNGSFVIPSLPSCNCPETVDFNFNFVLTALNDQFGTVEWTVQSTDPGPFLQQGVTVSSSGPLDITPGMGQFSPSAENTVSFGDPEGDVILMSIGVAGPPPVLAYAALYACESTACTEDFSFARDVSDGVYTNFASLNGTVTQIYSNVPENSAALLALIGVVLVFAVRRRRVADSQYVA